jgi:A/G-specific adenine glycosylase
MRRVQPDRQKAGEISAKLLAHYDRHARALPWRIPPKANRKAEPYHVWLSEIMLQQTTVAAVMPYFEKFTSRWTDVAALAAADTAEVMAAWAGLGYYARARNLIACAKFVAEELGGEFPQDESDLLKLPGVGPYTSAAITAIAFGKRAVVVDANIERVVSRLFQIDTPLPQGKKEIHAATGSITPQERAGDFAQAMMDLGASLCSVKEPNCAACPLSAYCCAFQNGNATAYPVKAPKKAKPVRSGTVYWIERDGHVLLVRRGDKQMLGGMRALPDDGWAARCDGDGLQPFTGNWRILDEVVQHSFTHFSLLLRIAVTEGPQQAEFGEYWPINSLDKAGLPTLFFKAATAAMSDYGANKRF